MHHFSSSNDVICNYFVLDLARCDEEEFSDFLHVVSDFKNTLATYDTRYDRHHYYYL